MNKNEKKVSLLWMASMLIMWVNGLILFSKGRKLKIKTWTNNGFRITLLNFLTPIICVAASDSDFIVVLTLFWFISPIIALFVAISKREEYIEKMTLINFAKANNLQYKNIDELSENYNKYIGKDTRTEEEKWEDLAKKQSDTTEATKPDTQTANFNINENVVSIDESDSVKENDIIDEKEQAGETVKEDISINHTEEKPSKLEDRLKKLK